MLLLIFLLNSGTGHGWGTGAYVIVSLPLGLVALGLEYLSPGNGFIFLLPILGLIQFGAVGYLTGRRMDRNHRHY